jgi:hypothetical protein
MEGVARNVVNVWVVGGAPYVQLNTRSVAALPQRSLEEQGTGVCMWRLGASPALVCCCHMCGYVVGKPASYTRQPMGWLDGVNVCVGGWVGVLGIPSLETLFLLRPLRLERFHPQFSPALTTISSASMPTHPCEPLCRCHECARLWTAARPQPRHR